MYRNLDDEITPFHSVYLDPIDLVLVRTRPRSNGTAVIRRRQLVDFAMSSIFENFMAESAGRLDAWFLRVSEDAENVPDLKFKSLALADLDVDPVERDILFDGLEVMIDLKFGRTEIDSVHVPQSVPAIAKALAQMGVPHCT